MLRMLILTALLVACSTRPSPVTPVSPTPPDTAAAPPASPPAPPNLDGTWRATLVAGKQELRMLLQLRHEASGLACTIISVDQGNAELPCTQATLADNVLRLAVSGAKLRFEGTATANRITGTFNQGAFTTPLAWEPGDFPARIRPQTPVAPLPYVNETLMIPVGKATPTHMLAATLSLPEGMGPFRAVVLVSGSGPQDRDEALLGHKPFAVLADYLTRAGLAVLRYDDRGTASSTGDFATATTRDFADDAAAAVAQLRTDSRIDGKRIGIIGHSEGGLIGPLVATLDRQLAFVVMIGGPGVAGKHILPAQSAALGRAMGHSASAIATQAQLLEASLALLAKPLSPDERETALQQSLKARVSATEFEQLWPLAKAGLAALQTPWMAYFLEYDPLPTMARVRVPVLGLWGELDLQVLPAQNLGPIKALRKKRGHRGDAFEVLPGLNHLMQHAKTGGTDEYAHIDETFAPEAMQRIATWIKALR